MVLSAAVSVNMLKKNTYPLWKSYRLEMSEIKFETRLLTKSSF